MKKRIGLELVQVHKLNKIQSSRLFMQLLLSLFIIKENTLLGLVLVVPPHKVPLLH